MAEQSERATKRRRLSIDGADDMDEQSNMMKAEPLSESLLAGQSRSSALSVAETESDREVRFGITEYIQSRYGDDMMLGLLKQRYTDFLVNEILPDEKTALHLHSLDPPSGAFSNSSGQSSSSTKVPISKAAEHATNKSSSVTNEAAVQDQEIDIAITGQTKSPKTANEVSVEEQEQLRSTLGEAAAGSVLDLYSAVLKHPQRKPKDFNPVYSKIMSDKESRTQAHQLIRQIFKLKLASSHATEDRIMIAAAGSQPRERGGDQSNSGPRIKNKLGWQELGGDYLHFNLYKENKDTMEVVSFLGSQLKVAPKAFQFAGTKDRRAVTVQRVSAYRIRAEQLAALNKRLRGSRVGDFKYERQGLSLGDLGGNEFLITLRDCRSGTLGDPGKKYLDLDMTRERFMQFEKQGFINYYGLQRFGVFSTSTDAVGVKMLQGDLKGAVDAILAYPPIDNSTAEEEQGATRNQLVSSDDLNRAEALHIWHTRGDAHASLAKLPKKFSAERSIISHLGARDRKTGQLQRPHDYQGALMVIPRNLRLMYVHAYQSLIWNKVASERWKKYKDQVCKGDLVMQEQQESTASEQVPEVDDQGETIVSAARTAPVDDFARARYVSEQEQTATNQVDHGSGSILKSAFDVVLPLPGFDVLYPDNEIGEAYKRIMAEDGLDPHDMRRTWKDISLSGSYRKLLAKPLNQVSFEVVEYDYSEDQLVTTDLDRVQDYEGYETSASESLPIKGDRELKDGIHKLKNPNPDSEMKHAVVVKMALAPSSYATMALRELSHGGVVPYKPDYGGRG